MSDNTFAAVGNLVGDWELRFVGDGKPVANNRVAVAKRRKNANGDWEETSSFYNVTAWDSLANNVATLGKGTRVVFFGTLEIREYEKDDQKRISPDVTLDAIGPDMRFASADVTRNEKGSNGAKGGGSSKGTGRKADPVYGDEEPF